MGDKCLLASEEAWRFGGRGEDESGLGWAWQLFSILGRCSYGRMRHFLGARDWALEFCAVNSRQSRRLSSNFKEDTQ